MRQADLDADRALIGFRSAIIAEPIAQFIAEEILHRLAGRGHARRVDEKGVGAGHRQRLRRGRDLAHEVALVPEGVADDLDVGRDFLREGGDDAILLDFGL